jgi:hypothetical protein
MRAWTDNRYVLVQTVQRAAAALAQGWRKLIGEPYRPEKHYMRGPGPKWRAKYAKVGSRRPQDAARGQQQAN